MNLIKKHLSAQLALLAGVVFSFSVLPSQSWAAFTIDSYNAPSAPWYNCPNINNVNLKPGTYREFDRNIGTLGGEGDFYFYADALNEPGVFGIKTFIHFRYLCNRLNQLVFAGNTEFDNETTGLSDGGYVRIVYDGEDNDIYTNDFGLGNIDLTEGGINNIFQLYISTSHSENTVDIIIYTDADNYSEALAIPVPNTTNTYRIFDIKFSEFVQGGALGPADFTNVNAIELQLNHPRTTGGTPLSVSGTPVGYGVGLDYFSVNKQLAATLSSGFSETTPGDDINGDGDFDSTNTDADIVTYTVAITNNNDWHDQPANGVTYTADFVGANASFINGSVATSQGTVTNNAGPVVVDIGDIADGATVTITYKVQIATGVLAVNQEYAHSGTVQTSDGLQINTAEDVFAINQFDISASLEAAPATGSDADGDGFSGPGESVTFTATVTNVGVNTSDSVVFYFPEIANASLVTGSVSTNSGTVGLGNGSSDTEVEVTNSNFAAGAVDTITFDMEINDPFFFAEYDSIGGQALLTDTAGTYSVLSDEPSLAGDKDPTFIQVDAFPNRAEALEDSDGDGLPENCDPPCVDEDANPNDTDNDGTPNDPDNPLADDDGDGVVNGEDAFPFIDEASSDNDGDGMPDSCINNCTNSGLTEDTDDDNDGVADIEDDFPLNAAAALDSDGDGKPDDWLAACNQACQDASDLTLDTDDDNDGVADDVDDFPLNVAASVDADGDGMPDAWNDGSNGSIICNATCQSESGLSLDPSLNDSDNDGVTEEQDAFPSNAAASVDDDGDGFPDEWNANCDATCQDNSGLTLDTSLNDSDNDGVIEEQDAFPSNAAASVDDDGDGFPDEWNANCDATCQNNSDLTLDTSLNDSDNDKVTEEQDAFPSNVAASVDGDSDGLPDAWNDGSNGSIVCDVTCQTESGLTLDEHLNDSNNDGVPNNANDDDGDGIPNGEDTEPTRDNNPPVVVAPVDRTADASGTLTSVALGQASAIDFLDGSLQATADNKGPFTVGVHIITWTAVDAAGNVGTDTQTVTVIGQDEGGNGSGGGGSLGMFALLILILSTGVRHTSRRLYS